MKTIINWIIREEIDLEVHTRSYSSFSSPKQSKSDVIIPVYSGIIIEGYSLNRANMV